MNLRLAPFAAAILSVACSSAPSIRDCGSDVECGAGNLCHAGACAVNAPPLADFVAPVDAATNRIVTLEASLSDPEGREVDAAWTVEPLGGGCAVDLEPQAGASQGVVFWCAGTYQATLVPIDDLGLQGEPVVRTLTVAASQGAPSVTAEPSIVATHSCALDGPSCVVAGPGGSASLQLGASATDPGGAPLAFEWIAVPPPEVAEDLLLRVLFLTGATIEHPIASIANGSGCGIAGVYRFRVRATNPAGLIGQAYQEVDVQNGAPVLAAPPWLLPHTFANERFVAEGDVATGAIDPDGDQLFAQGTLEPTPPAGCEETVTGGSIPGSVHVRIDCVAATDLLGPTPRTLSVTVFDSNGASAPFSAPLAIENRAPVISLDPAFTAGALAVEHRVEPCQLVTGSDCFVAGGADPFVVVDPDGDPLGEHSLAAFVTAGKTSSQATVTVEGGVRGFRVETATSRPSEFRSATGASGFSLTATIEDPWGLKATLTTPLTILNRPPAVKEAAPTATVPHAYDGPLRRYTAAAPGALFEDPDGDPLLPTVAPAGSCTSATIDAAGRATIACAKDWDYTLGGIPPLASFLAAGSVVVTASDGWESALSATAVSIQDRPTTLSLTSATVENCACIDVGIPNTGLWGAGGVGVRPVFATADPDGDPSRLTIDPTGTLIAFEIPPVYASCLPGLCTPSVTAFVNAAAKSSVTFSASVETDSGAAGVHPTLGVVQVTVTCSKVGSCPL